MQYRRIVQGYIAILFLGGELTYRHIRLSRGGPEERRHRRNQALRGCGVNLVLTDSCTAAGICALTALPLPLVTGGEGAGGRVYHSDHTMRKQP